MLSRPFFLFFSSLIFTAMFVLCIQMMTGRAGAAYTTLTANSLFLLLFLITQFDAVRRTFCRDGHEEAPQRWQTGLFIYLSCFLLLGVLLLLVVQLERGLVQLPLPGAVYFTAFRWCLWLIALTVLLILPAALAVYTKKEAWQALGQVTFWFSLRLTLGVMGAFIVPLTLWVLLFMGLGLVDQIVRGETFLMAEPVQTLTDASPASLMMHFTTAAAFAMTGAFLGGFLTSVLQKLHKSKLAACAGSDGFSRTEVL